MIQETQTYFISNSLIFFFKPKHEEIKYFNYQTTKKNYKIMILIKKQLKIRLIEIAFYSLDTLF